MFAFQLVVTYRTFRGICRAKTPNVTLQELLKKCHQCMETIVKAKDQQAAEANKNATILLKELDLEKVISVTCDSVLGGKSILNKRHR